MKLKGILLTILPTALDPDFYSRWDLLGKVYFDNDKLAPEDIEAVVTDHHTLIDNAFVRRFPNLKYVVSPNTGHTHLTFHDKDIKLITLRNEIMFLRGIRSVSEFTILSMLKLARESNDPKLLCRKQLGIVGLGRIGSQVYQLAKAFGMNVVYNDKTPKFGMMGFVNVIDLMRESDFVSIHIPESRENNGYISKSLIHFMKESAFFINTARASVVNNEALFDAYDDGRIAGIASDVNWDMRDGYPLETRKKSLILTPHIAGCTYEDRVATDRFVLGKLAKELNLPLDNIP